MFDNLFNQSFIAASYNGVILQGFMDGESINIKIEGGEVELTHGTDGGSMNIATLQGASVEINLRESSPSHEFLFQMNRHQAGGGAPATLVLSTGTGRQLSILNAVVGVPGPMSTGNKQQGAHTYRFVGTQFSWY